MFCVESLELLDCFKWYKSKSRLRRSVKHESGDNRLHAFYVYAAKHQFIPINSFSNNLLDRGL